MRYQPVSFREFIALAVYVLVWVSVSLYLWIEFLKFCAWAGQFTWP